MRSSYPQPDGRSIARRKWSTFKEGGPLVYFCELVLKKLIQHGFAASYRIVGNQFQWVLFQNEIGETPEFLLCLKLCVEVLERRCKVTGQLLGAMVRLVGQWDLRLRYAKDGKIAAVTFVSIGLGDPPF